MSWSSCETSLFLWGKGYLSVGRALEKGDFPVTVLRVFPFLISLARIKVIYFKLNVRFCTSWRMAFKEGIPIIAPLINPPFKAKPNNSLLLIFFSSCVSQQVSYSCPPEAHRNEHQELHWRPSCSHVFCSTPDHSHTLYKGGGRLGKRVQLVLFAHK